MRFSGVIPEFDSPYHVRSEFIDGTCSWSLYDGPELKFSVLILSLFFFGPEFVHPELYLSY